METKLKQRVVGAVVLTTLAIIILPMLLDGSVEDRARVTANIPEAPRIELKSLIVSQVKQQMQAMEQESTKRLPVELPDDKAIEAEEDTAAYELDKNDLPVSWTLKLGSFRQRDNAVKLRKTLRDAEFKTYVLTADSSEGQVFRVYVGPMINKSKLEEFAVDIESRFDLRGQIIRYRIENDLNQLSG